MAWFRLGFSGTRQGMSDQQRAIVREWFALLRPDALHHGDCVGADAEAHQIALSCPSIRQIVVHPPDLTKHRAFCVPLEGHGIIWTPKPYLQRNHSIVDNSNMLLACPAKNSRGTIYTIAYAKQRNRTVLTVWPNGHIEVHFKGDKR